MPAREPLEGTGALELVEEVPVMLQQIDQIVPQLVVVQDWTSLEADVESSAPLWSAELVLFANQLRIHSHWMLRGHRLASGLIVQRKLLGVGLAHKLRTLLACRRSKEVLRHLTILDGLVLHQRRLWSMGLRSPKDH